MYQFAAEDNKKITHLDSFAEAFFPKCTLGQMISRYMVLIASEQKLIDDASVSDLCSQGHRGVHSPELRQWLYLAYHRQRQDTHLFQGLHSAQGQPRHRKMRVCRGPQRPRSADAGRIQPVSGRLRRGKYTHRRFGATAPFRRLRRQSDRHHHPEARPGPGRDSKRSKENKKQGKATYKEQLEPLRQKRMVFIFDECHRSQFGENHKAIKEFFPNSQLFGFTGTPIFEQNATYQQIDGQQASLKTTADIFQRELHAYTITHAIDDRNVLRFHIDYYKPEGKNVPKQGETLAKQAIVEAILDKHDAATGGRRFNATLATASINDAIEYFDLFKSLQERKRN